ncbi:hypothetical protein GN244_ATG17905 [Phytophthora infestans]|uniref:Uncharacterized protein n=1 Tax=Phytophthora infestans TaxID=4787 RepID=A0A833RQ65_PHYIN|nr:hypothetical protein GN244_ATG17905 [Phytophthora infestans]
MEWGKVMQFKNKWHVVDSYKSDHAWNTWLHATQGEMVKLLVYEYGITIATNQVRSTFMAACIDPLVTDRVGVAAECCLQEFVEQLKERWKSEYNAPHVVWRMWANRLMSNLDRSTWEHAINRDPSADFLKLLCASESRLAKHLTAVTYSSNLALTCIAASLESCKLLRHDLETYERRLRDQERDLKTHKSVIECFMLDVLPSQDVPDPLKRLENILDVDHE